MKTRERRAGGAAAALIVCRRCGRWARPRLEPRRVPSGLRLTVAQVDLLILLCLASAHDGGAAEHAVLDRLRAFRSDSRAV